MDHLRANVLGMQSPHARERASGPRDVTLSSTLGPGDPEAAAALLADQYWNDDVTRDEIADAHRGSGAWVGARDQSGALIATARAIGDGVKHVYDVAVHATRRGEGIGKRVLALLLEQPIVRRARKVHLGTRDAMRFYEAFGFVRRESVARPYTSTEMVLLREPPRVEVD